jgi:hypothetical protein
LQNNTDISQSNTSVRQILRPQLKRLSRSAFCFCARPFFILSTKNNHFSYWPIEWVALDQSALNKFEMSPVGRIKAHPVSEIIITRAAAAANYTFGAVAAW